MKDKGMRARWLCVLLDGQPHTLQQIAARIEHQMDPSRAVRVHANGINSQLNHKRKRNKTGRILQRKPMMVPEELDVGEAKQFQIMRSLMIAVTAGVVTRVDDRWQITDLGRERCKIPQVAGAIAAVLKRNLLAHGRLL